MPRVTRRRRVHGPSAWFLLPALALLSPPAASAYEAPGPRWPGSTIRVFSALPPAYDVNVAQAMRVWNSSGASIRFALVKRRADAHTVIVHGGPRSGHSATADVGYRPGGSRVTVSSVLSPRPKNPNDVALTRLLAHELGHVLGLGHTDASGCQVMQAYGSQSCEATPWATLCRPGRDDARGVVRLYGGTVRLARSRFCRLQSRPVAPRAFRGVRLSDGSVRVAWSRQSGFLPGDQVQVDVYRSGGSCEGHITSATLPFRAGSWRDPTAADRGPGAYCYTATVRSRYGEYGRRVTAVVDVPWTPFSPPAVTSLREYPDAAADPYGADYAVTVVPDGASLVVRRGPPGACPRTPSDGEEVVILELVGAQVLLGSVPRGASCLAFFSTDWSARAPGRSTREVVHGERPEPLAPPA